jgi:hypothetical protein
MTKYLLLYRAPVSAAEEMANTDPEAAQAGMDAWMAWSQRPTQLPVLTMITGYARWACGVLVPTRRAEDLYAGWWRLNHARE